MHACVCVRARETSAHPAILTLKVIGGSHIRARSCIHSIRVTLLFIREGKPAAVIRDARALTIASVLRYASIHLEIVAAALYLREFNPLRTRYDNVSHEYHKNAIGIFRPANLGQYSLPRLSSFFFLYINIHNFPSGPHAFPILIRLTRHITIARYVCARIIYIYISMGANNN